VSQGQATAEARKACVIGWPAGHSRSPLIHNYWLRQHGIAGAYVAEAVPPEKFAEFVQALASRNYAGANVTIPHKEAALNLSMPDDTARAIGAANTLWLEAGALRSTNTDVEGFLANLDAAAPGWDGATDAVVLGAGGSARAVVFGLKQRGFARIHVVNRTPERSESLRARFGDAVRPAHARELNILLAAAGLLVNTTSLGMRGQPPLAVDLASLRTGAVVADLVYVPLETDLLAAARTRGHRTADGLGMLLHQAVRGFSLWFGVRPEVTAELRTLIERDLTKA
jgi:shikimate dehydrogenase